eukprot:6482895-Amphidinium_carterae.1
MSPLGVPKPPGLGHHPRRSQSEYKCLTGPPPRRPAFAVAHCVSVGGQGCPTCMALCHARMAVSLVDNRWYSRTVLSVVVIACWNSSTSAHFSPRRPSYDPNPTGTNPPGGNLNLMLPPGARDVAHTAP